MDRIAVRMAMVLVVISTILMLRKTRDRHSANRSSVARDAVDPRGFQTSDQVVERRRSGVCRRAFVGCFNVE